MITLETLSQASEQEVFDQVASHLLGQNEKSEMNHNGYGCAYRGRYGLKCAAGCLIDDEEYYSDMEGCNWETLIVNGRVPKAHSALIEELQIVHDSVDPSQWKDSLTRVAKIFDLECRFNNS